MTATEMQWTRISNQCTCTDYDEESGVETESENCYGYCWKDAMESFESHCGDFFDSHRHDYHISGFARWDGSYDGIIAARTGSEFIHRLTGRISSWSGSYTMSEKDGEQVLLFSLAHHDVPTGRTMEIRKREYQD